MIRAALYHRASTVDQDKSIAREELKAAAAARGCDIVLDVEETGSGARNDRPGLQRLLSAARRRRIDCVFVWKLDRFGRSSLDLLSNLRELENCGVRFIAITQGIDIHAGGDAMSRLLVGMLSAISEFERDLIRERTRLGLDKARRRGKKLGRPRNRNAPDPDAVRAARKAGQSWRQISERFKCSISATRRAAERCRKGSPAEALVTVENSAAA